MTIKDAIKQLEKGYNLTNFQVAELLKDYESNSGGNTDTVSVYKISVDDTSFSWSKLTQSDAIQFNQGEELGTITMFKGMNEGTGEVAFYAQITQESGIIMTFVKEEGDIAVVKTTDFFAYQKLADIIDGTGDSYVGLSTRGAKNYLVRKADLVNGLVPAEQLPSYVDDVVNFNGSTIDIISENTENSILEYGQNTVWIGNSSVEPYRSKYYQKLIYVNANTSKEDWVIKDPEEGKIYVNIGPNGESTTGDTYRWSGKAWVNLNQNLNAKIDALNATVKEINLGNNVNIYDLESLPSDKVLAIWDVIVTGATHIEFTYNICRIASQRIDYVNKAFSLILPNGQIDNYIFSGSHPDNLHLIKSSSSGRVVLLKESNLNKTYTNQNHLDDLTNAAKLIVEFPNAGIKEFHRGSVSGDVINYINTNSTSGAQVITFNSDNGKLSGMTYSTFAPNALFYGDYTSAGGSLSKPELNSWLADASSTHIVVVPDTQLGKVVTDSSLKAKLDNAGLLVISRSNDYQIILKSVGYLVNNIHSFVGANTNISFQQVNYNIQTGKLSSLINMSNTAYSEYLNVGGTVPEVTFNNWYTLSPSSTLYIDRSNIGVTLEESKDALIKGSSTIIVRDISGSKSSVSFLRTSTENNNYIWYGWLNASTVERLSYDDSTRKFAITNMQIGKDSLDSRIMNLPYSQLGTTVSSVAGQGIKRSSAIVLTTTDANNQYNNVMFTRASTSATEIKFVNPTITGNSYGVEYITYNPETRSLSSINV